MEIKKISVEKRISDDEIQLNELVEFISKENRLPRTGSKEPKFSTGNAMYGFYFVLLNAYKIEQNDKIINKEKSSDWRRYNALSDSGKELVEYLYTDVIIKLEEHKKELLKKRTCTDENKIDLLIKHIENERKLPSGNNGTKDLYPDGTSMRNILLVFKDGFETEINPRKENKEKNRNWRRYNMLSENYKEKLKILFEEIIPKYFATKSSNIEHQKKKDIEKINSLIVGILDSQILPPQLSKQEDNLFSDNTSKARMYYNLHDAYIADQELPDSIKKTNKNWQRYFNINDQTTNKIKLLFHDIVPLVVACRYYQKNETEKIKQYKKLFISSNEY